MNKKVLVLAITALLMVGCAQRGTSSVTSESSSGSGSSSESSSEGQSSSGESSSGGESSSEDSSSESSSSEEEPQEETPTDLGVMTIAQANAWLEEHKGEIPRHANDSRNGVDKTRMITVRGYAIGKFDTVKTMKKYGLDNNKPGRVILGDVNGYIVVESDVTKGGSNLYDKLDDKYVNKDTSKYEVTGYPSITMGQVHLQIPSNKNFYTLNQNLDITKNISSYIDETIELSEFFNEVKDTQYNCSGHGYDKVYCINSLTCYHYNSKDNFYYFTDGERIVKVMDQNLTASIGYKYNVIGMATTKNYAPAIQAISLEPVTGEGAAVDTSKAITRGSVDLLKIKTSQDETSTRFDNFVLSFGGIYKAEVHFNVATENSNYYVGFSDAVLNSGKEITGKDNAGTAGLVFVDNNRFWNVTKTEINTYNGYKDLIGKNETGMVYYIPVQVTYSSNKPIYKVFLLPETIPAVV